MMTSSKTYKFQFSSFTHTFNPITCEQLEKEWKEKRRSSRNQPIFVKDPNVDWSTKFDTTVTIELDGRKSEIATDLIPNNPEPPILKVSDQSFTLCGWFNEALIVDMNHYTPG